jgi:hypothetical protein
MAQARKKVVDYPEEDAFPGALRSFAARLVERNHRPVPAIG